MRRPCPVLPADEGRNRHLDAGAHGEEAKELARPLPNDALIISSREPYGSTIVSKSGELVEQGSLL